MKKKQEYLVAVDYSVTIDAEGHTVDSGFVELAMTPEVRTAIDKGQLIPVPRKQTQASSGSKEPVGGDTNPPSDNPSDADGKMSNSKTATTDAVDQKEK